MYYRGSYYVVEVERWTNMKNSGLTTYLPIKSPQTVFDEITNWLLSHTNGEAVDVFLTGYAEGIVPKFEYYHKVTYDHHTSHAATAFYQSPYEEMLVFTFDGGGDGAFFNVYLASRLDGIKLVARYNYDLGFPYMVMSEVLDDIKREDLAIGNLVYAGKLMGLCAYGVVRDEWIEHFNEFYNKFYYDGVSYMGGTQIMENAMNTLMCKIGLSDYIYGTTRYSGQIAWDIAATSQQAFENMFLSLASEHLELYPDLPVGLAGGCALNVLLNTKIAIQRHGNVFVPPNANDCGISVGAILNYIEPRTQVDLTYTGIPVLDEHLFSYYTNKYNLIVQDNVALEELAGYIVGGHIVGFIQGNAEHGSRALGNRSILCIPSGNMKDVINAKVKHREWYRPFAPVVRFDEVSKYFDFDYESRHMTYAAPVKMEYRSAIPAITHEDGTGRLQTVTSEQNPMLYDLLGLVGNMTGIGVLLNTSFNINGKPILSTLFDAFDLLRTTDMDAVFYKGKLIYTTESDRSIIMNRSPLNPSANKLSVCLIYDGKYYSDILKNITSIAKEFDSIVLVATEDVCAKVKAKQSNVNTYPLGPDKFYHGDRLKKYMPVNEIPNRLKLIWLREVCFNVFKSMNSVIAVDLSHGIDGNSLLHSMKQLRDKHYENYSPIVYDQTIYENGFGVITGKVEDLKLIVNMTESILVECLASEVIPPNDKDMFRMAIV